MQKVIGIHQPNFIPWLGYFNKIYSADVFVILDKVDYQSGNANSITNRTKIKTAQGELFISVPVKKNAESKLIKDIAIDNQQPWEKKMLKTIQLNYSKAKFFSEFFPLIENVLSAKHELLSAMNVELIKLFCEKLNIATPIVLASEMNLSSDEKNNRIIEICKSLEATIYQSGNGARKYNDENLFAENKIELRYTSFSPAEYPQLHGAFINGLSVIDVVMNCGWEQTATLIKGDQL
ncbi:MAG: WbqC family protein [Bacteroidota bacterium]